MNNIDVLNKTAPNFFPFGKGEKITNLFGKGERINILPVEDEIIDLNQLRKERFVQNCSNMSPC